MSMMGGDFDAWFGSLSPEDQEYVAQMLQMGSGSDPYTFGGGQVGLSPSEADLAGYGAVLPDVDKYGNIQPWGLDQQSDAATLQKNLNALMADNMTAALGGPGAYGPEAFAPTLEWDSPVLQTPGAQMLDFYMGGPPSAEGLVAENIAAGMTPSQAVEEVLRIAQSPDDETLGEEERAIRQSVIDTLRPGRGSSQPPGVSQDLTPEQQLAQTYDLDSLYEFADQLSRGLASDPQGGYTDPETGLTYRDAPTEVYSAAAQKYLDLGLPFPTDQYTDDKYLDLAAPADWEGLDMAKQMALLDVDSTRRDWETQRTLDDFRGESTGPRIERQTANSEPTKRWVRPEETEDARMMTAPTLDPAAVFERKPLTPQLATPTSILGSAPTQLPGETYRKPAEYNFAQAVQPFSSAAPEEEMTYVWDGSPTGGGARIGGAQSSGARAVPTREVRQGSIRAQQEALRRAVSRSMDARLAYTDAERGRAGALGAANALAGSGRTPLQDALMKRMMIGRQQGYR